LGAAIPVLVIRTIYENGVFRPLDPVDLPNGTEVELHNLRLVTTELDQDLDAIHKAMDQRFNSGHTNTAARHNEHQP
jgi:predicted DNA-binding antitoxin AbrB/MazE fold protein